MIMVDPWGPGGFEEAGGPGEREGITLKEVLQEKANLKENIDSFIS